VFELVQLPGVAGSKHTLSKPGAIAPLLELPQVSALVLMDTTLGRLRNLLTSPFEWFSLSFLAFLGFFIVFLNQNVRRLMVAN
jgi:hypothetical protein